MKLSLWIYTAAVTVTAYAVSEMGDLLSNIFYGLFGNKPLPRVTTALVEHSWWALLIPLPFIITSILLCRGQAATISRCLAFAAISTLAVAFLFAFIVLASTCPFIFIHGK
jgi:hypothetical protein